MLSIILRGGERATQSTLPASRMQNENAALGERRLNQICFPLQRRLDLKAPGLQQRLRDVLRVLVAPRPFAQAGRADVLIGSEFVLLHHLLKGGDGGDYRADRLRLAPVGISTTLCHRSRFLLGSFRSRWTW